MQKRIIRVFLALSLSFALLPMVSCGKDEPINQEVEIVIPDTTTPEEQEQFNLKRDIVGSWRVLEDRNKTVVFYADGHGFLDISGERESFTWDTAIEGLRNVTITQYFEGDHGRPYYINVDGDKKNNSELIHFIDGSLPEQHRYVTTYVGDFAKFTLVRI